MTLEEIKSKYPVNGYLKYYGFKNLDGEVIPSFTIEEIDNEYVIKYHGKEKKISIGTNFSLIAKAFGDLYLKSCHG